MMSRSEYSAGMRKWSALGADPELPPPGMPPELTCPEGYYGTPPNCHNGYLLVGGVFVAVGIWFWATMRKAR